MRQTYAVCICDGFGALPPPHLMPVTRASVLLGIRSLNINNLTPGVLLSKVTDYEGIKRDESSSKITDVTFPMNKRKFACLSRGIYAHVLYTPFS